MCGIAGIVEGRRDRAVDRSRLARMCAALRHRGPDDEGYYVGDGVGLGMRRLCIIDVKGGQQPISNEDETCHIVFNGEIYNYRELRDLLERKGHRFKTRSDTETILHLYEEYGEACVSRLRGMFAFAIWDTRTEALFAARDRLGEKPLYYTVQDGALIFASELKAILVHPDVQRRLDPEALSDFLSLLYVPAPRSIFEGIRKLPAGHVLHFRRGELRVQRYWQAHIAGDSRHREEEWLERFIELLEESVRIRLMSEVPLGAFLSGGVDSSLVVAMMRRVTDGPIDTFTIGYEEGTQHYDERRYARMVAEHLGTRHHEYVIRPELGSTLLRMVEALDEPFADSSMIPTYHLCEQVRRSVTVALSGLGGDELGGGYERYLALKVAGMYERVPAILRGGIAGLVRRVPDSRSGSLLNSRLKRFVDIVETPGPTRYFRAIAAFTEAEKRLLLSNEFLAQLDGRTSEDLLAPYFAGGGHLLEQMLLADINTYLVDDLLTLTDRASMAHSLEVRVPFLDHVLVEFFGSVPAQLKIKGFTKKYLIKRAAERFLPRAVIYRPKKGFSVPLAVWLRGELRPLLDEALSAGSLRRLPFLEYRAIRAVVAAHLSGQENHEVKLWALLTLVLWYRRYMER